MNYGHNCVMTDVDRAVLKHLYRRVWEGNLTEIEGVPIRMIQPSERNAVSHSLDEIVTGTLERKARTPVQIIIAGRKVTVE